MSGKVHYSIVSNQGIRFLRAESQKTSSGLFMPINFSVNEYPLLSWEWDVLSFPKKGTEIAKQNDDYAARIYVIFKSLLFFNSKCIEYVWDEHMPEGTIFESPNSKNIRFIVAQSGAGGKGWVREERNIYEDYLKAFGHEPNREVSGLALMTDSDNSQSSAEALYRRIEIGETP